MGEAWVTGNRTDIAETDKQNIDRLAIGRIWGRHFLNASMRSGML
jgi:hypothetical protein